MKLRNDVLREAVKKKKIPRPVGFLEPIATHSYSVFSKFALRKTRDSLTPDFIITYANVSFIMINI